MKSFTGRFVSAALLASAVGLLAGGAVRADTIKLSDVPAKARAAADKAVPKAKWTDASKEKDGDEVWYDLEGTDAKGRYVCVSVYPDGNVDEVTTEVQRGDVPEPVLTAVKKHKELSGFKATTYYEVRDGDGKLDRYDLEGAIPSGKKKGKDKEVTVSVSPDGKEVEIDSDTAVARLQKVKGDSVVLSQRLRMCSPGGDERACREWWSSRRAKDSHP